MRSTFWTAAAVVLAGCGGGGASDPSGSGEAPPSVILVSVDTLRADHLGLYGYGRDTSPYLDRLADECLVFDRAYTTAAWTLVAHMSMMTGLEPEEHGVVQPNLALSPEVPPVAVRLREAGYRTIGFYSGSWVEPRYGFDRGFDVYRGYDTPEEARAAVGEALAEHNPARPLFLFLHIFDVHTAPFTPDFRGFYDPPEPYDTQFIADARERLAHVDCRSVWDGKGRPLNDDEVEALVALYDGGVRHADAMLSDWVEGWRADGLLDRSLLLITSDHGESLGQRGRVGGHGGMYEEGLRIPLMVRFPDGHRAGEREPGVVSVVDFAPTFLEIAGLSAEPWRSGHSLRLPPLPERVVRAQRALVGGTWKLNQTGAERLAFNLAEDAGEVAPYSVESEEMRAAIRDLRRRYEEQLAARAPLPGQAVELRELDEATRAELRNLGYAGELGD
ncbi:MAG: sulfatase-like hydrolase/transferase [Planctomycetota bacterium]